MSDETTPGLSPAHLERRLATILSADVAGYSQMMGINEERTVQVFRGHREIFETLVKLHRGRIFNTAGDALLAEFNSAVEAVRCATEIQAALRTRNEHLAPEEKMQFRMGINLGDVIVQGGDLLGDGVNVASRIQTATEPGGICISGSVHDQIQNKLSLDFKLLGEQRYKNIAKPVRTYTIDDGWAVTAPASRPWPKIPVAIAAALVLIAGAGYWGYQQYDARRAEQARTESELTTQLAQQKQATEEARRDALLQTKKQAEETLRRAQEERKRLEQERLQLDAQKQADAAKKPAAPRPAPAVSRSTSHDGTYLGQLCNHFKDDRPPNCWSVALVVRNGLADGSWISRTQKTSKATGTVATNGALDLKLAAWTKDGKPIDAVMSGRILPDAVTASGKWRDGAMVVGDWKRAGTTTASAAPVAPKSPPLEGTYLGQLCNHIEGFSKPDCWSISLTVRDGSAEGSWVSTRTQRTSKASGTVAANGTLDLRLAAWAGDGRSTDATLAGRVSVQAITASGKWRDGTAVTGDWKRKQ